MNTRGKQQGNVAPRAQRAEVQTYGVEIRREEQKADRPRRVLRQLSSELIGAAREIRIRDSRPGTIEECNRATVSFETPECHGKPVRSPLEP